MPFIIIKINTMDTCDGVGGAKIVFIAVVKEEEVY